MDADRQINLTRADLDRRLPRDVAGVAQSEIDRLQAELDHRELSFENFSAANARDTANASRNLDQLNLSVGRIEQSVELVRERSVLGLANMCPWHSC